MELTKKQKKEWEQWLSERPENVRKVAEKIVPWKKYYLKGQEDLGNTYSVICYDEAEDGSVTLTCEKENEIVPFLGGYNVFGMDPESLIEVE